MENGRVEIQLDRKRYLKFNNNAWCEVDGLLGSLDESVLRSFRGFRALLYGGLIDDDPKLTPKKVSEFIDTYDAAMIGAKVREAIRAANPESEVEISTIPNVVGAGKAQAQILSGPSVEQ